MPHILIFQGAPHDSQAAVAAAKGGKSNTELFTTAFQRIMPNVETFTLNVADGERFPQGYSLEAFDGVVITGSPLNAYKDEPAVRHQLTLAREVFERGIPSFGSCWGLQIMAAALGGTVRLNPNGREFGIARNIALTEAGRGHALYAGKDHAFDALCSHEDEVESLPEGGTILASNAVSRVQAAEIVRGNSCFWGVQYHPEFDFGLTAALMTRRASRQIADGFANSQAEVTALAEDFHALDAAIAKQPASSEVRAKNPASSEVRAKQPASSDVRTAKNLAWRYGVSANILDPYKQRLEFRNWLTQKVLPYSVART